MTAPVALVALLEVFVECFTKPGYQHFRHFVQAHVSLWGGAHCVTETLRRTRWHDRKHWTTPYVFLRTGRWSCRAVSRCLFDLVCGHLGLGAELVFALDDTLVKKWGREFFGLGCYPDPTDKNPGASRRRVWGHCWVVLALLWERAPRQWFCFPFAARLFVPEKRCGGTWPFRTKIELAVELLEQLTLGGRRVTLLVDNLYAKLKLLVPSLGTESFRLISRLRSNAALYELPPPRRPGQRGRKAVRGTKVTIQQLWLRRSKRKILRLNLYGKDVVIKAFVGVVMPSPRLGNLPILLVLFPQRSGRKFNLFFTNDLELTPERLLELYAARFKIEDAFDELKTHGGFADCRQRSAPALKRHATLCLVAYSLLRLLSVTLKGAEALATDPWWHPKGPPSVTRLRRLFAAEETISCRLHTRHKRKEIPCGQAAA